MVSKDLIADILGDDDRSIEQIHKRQRWAVKDFFDQWENDLSESDRRAIFKAQLTTDGYSAFGILSAWDWACSGPTDSMPTKHVCSEPYEHMHDLRMWCLIGADWYDP